MDVPVTVWILRIRVLMLDQTPPPPAGAFGYPWTTLARSRRLDAHGLDHELLFRTQREAMTTAIRKAMRN